MTRQEALNYCRGRYLDVAGLRLGTGYIQSELELIWETGSHEPINEIAALGFSKREARKLWNARNHHD